MYIRLQTHKNVTSFLIFIEIYNFKELEQGRAGLFLRVVSRFTLQFLVAATPAIAGFTLQSGLRSLVGLPLVMFYFLKQSPTLGNCFFLNPESVLKPSQWVTLVVDQFERFCLKDVAPENINVISVTLLTSQLLMS